MLNVLEYRAHFKRGGFYMYVESKEKFNWFDFLQEQQS